MTNEFQFNNFKTKNVDKIILLCYNNYIIKMRKEMLKMKIIKELEYNEKEKQISFNLYDKTWCSTKRYSGENLEDTEKLKKEIARNIILQQFEIKVNSTNGIELMYSFLKTAKEVREFLSTFDKAIEEPVTLSDEIGNFRFYLCGNYGEEAKEKAEFFLENIAIPKFWEYFSDKNKSRATLYILHNNIKKYIKSAEIDENGYIKKIKWTRKNVAIDYKTAYVYNKFNSQFNFEAVN